MNETAPELLTSATLDFLQRFSPFNRMEGEAIRYLSERLQLAFYPAGSKILNPEMGRPRHFHIIERGRVQARQIGAPASADYASLTLNPGECFPVGAVSAQRAASNIYTALEDSYIYLLPVEDFSVLMQMSPVFHLFCTRYIASLLNQSRRQLQITFTQRAAEQHTMTTPLSRLLQRELVSVTPDTPLRDALEQMDQKQVDCVVVAEQQSHPSGVLTQSDLLPRIVLPRFDLSRPISDVMSTEPFTMPATASAYDAALSMATHGVQHIVIVDPDERTIGVVSERDLFSLQRISMRQIRAAIDGAEDIDALERASQDIRQLALNLVAQGIAAEQLTQFISALNDALTRRIITLAEQNHQLDDIDYVWLAFGSEGRQEQTLLADQNNGLLFVCSPGQQRERVRQRLLAFAREVNARLAQCGFPRSRKSLEASCAHLCLTTEEWRERFTHCMNEAQPDSLEALSSQLDFRALTGDGAQVEQLRDWLYQASAEHPDFLRTLAADAVRITPPLGHASDFSADEIDLKYAGTRLFVDAARVFALRYGAKSTSTAQRMRLSAEQLGLDQEDLAAIVDGFHFIQMLRLRCRHLESDGTGSADNVIAPEALNELDRRILKEALRQARKLQKQLIHDYRL